MLAASLKPFPYLLARSSSVSSPLGAGSDCGPSSFSRSSAMRLALATLKPPSSKAFCSSRMSDSASERRFRQGPDIWMGAEGPPEGFCRSLGKRHLARTPRLSRPLLLSSSTECSSFSRWAALLLSSPSLSAGLGAELDFWNMFCRVSSLPLPMRAALASASAVLNMSLFFSCIPCSPFASYASHSARASASAAARPRGPRRHGHLTGMGFLGLAPS
mmetsp:Transcript_61861/g.184270  ORF Transcript_61861/g.184270 Transcript_61861/m.184270 type:complete len:217 (-) Transcript_61861:497-1147(-)